MTDHFQIKDNDLIYRLAGRAEVVHGAALYNFIKSGRIQQAVHSLKYRDKPEIGLVLGQQYGEQMIASALFETPDYIIPIPLHHNKQKNERGYNQSEEFAKGISSITGSKVDTSILIKHIEIDSQTSKGRADRFNNVLNSFKLIHPEKLEGKSVLLVDDVMTTGATIEAAYTLLSPIKDIKLYIGLIVLADG